MEDDYSSEANGRKFSMKLTRVNWNEFKAAFMDYCLNFREAGDMIITGINPFGADEEPGFDDMVEVEVDGLPVNQRRFPDNDRGFHRWNQLSQSFRKRKDDKRKLMAKLFECMDKEIRDSVKSSDGYDAAMAASDLLAIWNITQLVVNGRGDISLNQRIVALFKLKQEGRKFDPYMARFFDEVADITRHGNAQQVLDKMFNTLFIIGLNQDQFKDKLQRVYGEHEWPNYRAFGTELHAYAQTTGLVDALMKKEEDGRVQANKAEGREPTPNVNVCWNCGKSHPGTRKDCRQAKAKCTACGGLGHMTKYCPKGKNDEERGSTSPRKDGEKKSYAGVQQKGNGPQHEKKPKPTNKKLKRDKIRKVIKAQMTDMVEKLMTTYDGGEHDIDEVDQEDDYEEEQDNNDDDDGEDHLYGATNIIFGDEGDESSPTNEVDTFRVGAMVSKFADPNGGDRKFKMDTACIGAHVCRNPEVLESAKKRGNASVEGITGDSIETTHVGYLPGMDYEVGRTVCAPKASSNLLCIKQLLKNGGHFEGNFHKMTVYDAKGTVIAHGRDEGDGYWTHTIPGEIVKANVAQEGRYYNAEERSRAREAFQLCPLLGHPSDDNIIAMLDKGAVTGTHLTAQDFRNARAIHGPCLACLEAKMKEDPKKTSLTPPATAVGQRLHMDLIPLKKVSLGGHTFILFSVDEYTGYHLAVPLKAKSKPEMFNAVRSMIAHYAQRQHKVTHICSDNEANFNSMKVELGLLGVFHSGTPSGLHERRAERHIQTLKSRTRAMIAQLSYELPESLKCEAYLATIITNNRIPNKITGTQTPYELVHGQKPPMPQFYFGQTGVFYENRKNSETRGEWGIFLTQGDGPNSYRAYIPTRDGIYSRRKFSPQEHVPKEWGLLPRIRMATEVKQDAEPVLNLHPTLPIPPPAHPTIIPFSTPVGTPQPMQAQAPPPAALAPPQHQEGENRIAQEGAARPTAEGAPVMQPIAAPPSPTTYKDAVIGVQAQPPTPPRPTKPAKPPTPVKPAAIPAADPPPTRIMPQRKAKEQTYKDGPANARGTYNASEVHAFTTILKREQKLAQKVEANHISLKSALKQTGPQATMTLDAIFNELTNMEQCEVMHPVKYQSIPGEYKKSIIPLLMFIKEKHKADGSFDKAKARMVARGDMGDPDMVGETFAPTVNPITVKTQLNLAAVNKNAVLAAYDIKSAFLLASIRQGKRIFVKVPKDIVQIWLKMSPEKEKFIHADGSLYCELDKYLYGLQESPHEFNKHLDSCLKKHGYKPTKADACFYTKKCNDGLITISVHVDDMLAVFPSHKERQAFEKEMKTHFQLVSQYKDISYLGMSIVRNEKSGTIHLNQKGFCVDIVKRCGFDKLNNFPKSPSTSELTENPDEDELLDAAGKTKFFVTLIRRIASSAP